jgi:chemotaxis protein CheC
MMLSDGQTDALTELINIAFGRTAAALSDITGHRVLLEAPDVAVLRLQDLASTLTRFVPGDVASVHQDFTGPVAGDALLVLSQAGAVELTGLLTESAPRNGYLDESAREVLTEVGNILLNACLGMFGNLLQVRVGFSVPRLHLDSVDAIMARLTRGETTTRHALIVSMAFRVKASAVTGCLAVVLGVASLSQLMAEVDKWEARAGDAQ